MNQDEIEREMMRHAWQYFKVHSDHRISMFNHFVVLFGIVAAGLAACLQAKGILRLVGGGLGIILAAVALSFYKIDARTSFLVKHAESAMLKLEDAFPVAEARLFTGEIPKTVNAGSLLPAIRRMWTYGYTLRFVFLLGGVVGLVGGLLSVARYFCALP